MNNNIVETLIGAVVLAIAAFFVVFAYSTAGVTPEGGYRLVAKFERVDGLVPGADVRLSGIKVGAVTDQHLEPETFLAVVTMSLNDDVKVPEDSAVKISSDGLLGDTYLSIEPGGSEDMLEPGGEIQYTQGAVNIIDLIGKAIYGSTQSQESK